MQLLDLLSAAQQLLLQPLVFLAQEEVLLGQRVGLVVHLLPDHRADLLFRDLAVGGAPLHDRGQLLVEFFLLLGRVGLLPLPRLAEVFHLALQTLQVLLELLQLRAGHRLARLARPRAQRFPLAPPGAAVATLVRIGGLVARTGVSWPVLAGLVSAAYLARLAFIGQLAQHASRVLADALDEIVLLEAGQVFALKPQVAGRLAVVGDWLERLLAGASHG